MSLIKFWTEAKARLLTPWNKGKTLGIDGKMKNDEKANNYLGGRQFLQNGVTTLMWVDNISIEENLGID